MDIIFQLFFLFVVFVIYWWIAHLLTMGWIPTPGPYVKRWTSRAIQACARFLWRHSFKNQYDRRGTAHAILHICIMLSAFATLGAITNPDAHLWGIVALWWSITLAYWFVLWHWKRLALRKRRLPSRRRWRYNPYPK